MSNWVGKILGKVRIDSLLARGGTAEVYIGTHTTLQRQVAIKILQSNYDDNPHALERFEREAMVVAKLRHPNIVQVFDFDTTTDSHPYLVMEYIKGPSLQKYLNALHAKEERLDFPNVVRLMNAMTSALQYAHDSGVIHRDIKPGNILLSSASSDIIPGKPLPADFEPVLTDFGLVRFMDSTQHTTGSGQIAGTPAYMSPEQARGDLTDGRTDIYSLGIVLYEILAGHLPFDGETTMGVLMKHINEPPSPIAGLPPTMQYVLDRALAKGLEDRFQTPAEFGKTFIAAVENKHDYGTLDMLSASPIKKPAKKIFGQSKKRNWMLPSLVAAVILVLGAFLFLKVFPSLSLASTPSATSISTTAVPSASPTNTLALLPLDTTLLGRTGVLQFQDGSAFLDQADLVAEALLAPPSGYQYEVWLVNGNQRLSLGILTLDENGKGELKYSQDQGKNLLASYDAVEITIEQNPDTNPKSSGIIAYSFTFPKEGLTHVRNLLVTSSITPKQTALIQGLMDDIRTINEFASQMQKASDNGNLAHVLLNAEAIQNIIVGDQSSNHKDWNNDGTVDDPSDGFGLLLNGRNPGYLRAVFDEANATVNSPEASEPMLTDGKGLEDSVQNLAGWTPQLQSLIAAILNAPQGADIQPPVAQVVVLANQMLNGIDLDNNGNVDAKVGEGGAETAYEQAYHMADMPLEAVGIANIGTGTPTFLSVPATNSGGGSGGGNATATRVPPGQQNRTPRPKNTPHGGGNNGNGGNANNSNNTSP